MADERPPSPPTSSSLIATLSATTPFDIPFDTVSIPTTLAPSRAPRRATRAPRRQSRQNAPDQSNPIRPPQPLPRNNPKLKPTFKRFSTNKLNNAMTSGSVRYLHINSRHLPRQETQEQFSINLLEPIRNASHLELVSFSVANDFSNVLPDNNKFRILFKRSPDTGTTALNDVYMVEVELETGFYTHDELIQEILAQITTTANGYYDSSTQTPDNDGFYTIYPKVLAVGSASFATQTTYGVLFKPTVESNGKTTLEFKPVTGTADGLKYALLSFPFEKYDEFFHDSILHRLGYDRKQVYFSDETITTSTSVFISNSLSNNRLVLTNQRIVLVNISEDSVAMSSNDITGFSRHFSNSNRQKYTSAKLAFETHSHLKLTCDLIHDIQTTTYNYRNLGKTEYSDTLASIPIDTNRASWIHYLPEPFNHIHKIDNPIIRNFKIGLKNGHSDRHFKSDEHKQFQITLKIYIMDDESIPNQQFFDSIKSGEQNFSYRN